MKDNSLKWDLIDNVKKVIAQSTGAILGLILILLIGSGLNWIDPIWWGGKALFPLVFGGLVLVLGAIPFYAIAYFIYYQRSIKTPSLKNFLLLGIVQGFLLLPLSFLVMIIFRTYFYQGELSGLLPIWTALGLAGVLATIGGAIVISFFKDHKGDAHLF